eukprot:286476_1
MSLLDFEYQLSPYYHKGHKEYRAYCRKFVKENLEPYAEDWIKKGKFNIHEYSKTLAEYGGIWYFPFGHCNTKWNGYDWDPFFQIIFYQEFAKPVFLAKSHVHRICIDPIEMFGKSEVHKNALKQISTGDKLICLAISEMSGGSDVKSIKTTATLSKDGKHYIVNGNKYWITAGLRADYFVTAVRTGTVEDGRNGVSLFLIPRTKGVYTSRLSLQGLNLSDTAVVTFANVKVPKENIIGELNKGWKPLMMNFNLERFCICCDVISYCIVCVEETIKWAQKRFTFGKQLIKHQVIRHKIANMSRKVLSCQSLLERVAYQLKNDRHMKYDKSIARNIALLKVHATETFQYCTIEASQIFGGRSYCIGGIAAKVERCYRYVRATSIYGGSAEIMLNLAMKQAKL